MYVCIDWHLAINLLISNLSNSNNNGNMPSGDHGAVWAVTAIKGRQESNRFFLMLEY